jgi:23S rRNA pseudouridine1911/1915/1917 synthase
MIVDKPPFLLIHPTKPGHVRTLWGELKQLLAFEIENGGQVSIVNRLDRETSGLVLIAKNAGTARRFGLLMQEQRIAKEYLAIVWGWPEWETNSVDAPPARQGAHRPSAIWLKQTIHPEGAPARTDFRVEQRFSRNNGERFSIIRAFPRTGRTHQIRVHLAAIGHPVVGDDTYGGGGGRRLLGLPPHRHFLHAAWLGFKHPLTGEDLEFRAPLPDDLATVLAIAAGEDAAPAGTDPLEHFAFYQSRS